MLIIGFFINCGIFMMNTLVPKYTDSLGASAAMVGTVTSVFSVAAFCIRLVAGPSMDYFKKGMLLRLSLCLMAVSFVGYGATQNMTLIILTRVLHGASCSVATPLTLVMASETLPENRMASGIGIFSLGQAFATALGPSLGLWLVGTVGYSWSFYILALLLVACAVASLGIKTSDPVRDGPFRIRLDRVFVPQLFGMVMMITLNTLALASINSFLILYGERRGVSNAGLFYVTNAFALVLARALSGKLADKYSTNLVMIPGLLIYIASFVLLSSAKTLPMFLITGAVSAFGYGISSPLLSALCLQLVPKNIRGAASNTMYFGVDIGLSVGSALAGFIVTSIATRTGSELTGYSRMFLWMIVPILIMIAYFLITRKKLTEKLNRIRALNMQEDAAEEPTAEIEPV